MMMQKMRVKGKHLIILCDYSSIFEPEEAPKKRGRKKRN